MSQKNITTNRAYIYRNNKFISQSTDLIAETPLEIIINGASQILMCTPHMLKELVIGFVFTEGFIHDISEIDSYTISVPQSGDERQDIYARVFIPSFKDGTSVPTRISYSSCGVCGRHSLKDLQARLTRNKSRHRFSMEMLIEFTRKMKDCQPVYKKTGGAHVAILIDKRGATILAAEDMGRHNALDKVIGAILIKKISISDKAIISSGRASLEMILKTARIGIPLFLALSRPTSGAVEAAKFFNITLVDMARGSNRIYTHARRIEEFQSN